MRKLYRKCFTCQWLEDYIPGVYGCGTAKPKCMKTVNLPDYKLLVDSQRNERAILRFKVELVDAP